jgi:hypothetical protein
MRCTLFGLWGLINPVDLCILWGRFPAPNLVMYLVKRAGVETAQESGKVWSPPLSRLQNLASSARWRSPFVRSLAPQALKSDRQ